MRSELIVNKSDWLEYYSGEYQENEEIIHIFSMKHGKFIKWDNGTTIIEVDGTLRYVWWKHVRDYWKPFNKFIRVLEDED